MSPARATAISCTQCGAGLDVLGGGRVRAHICGYCGAELDAQDDYKVLRRFRDLKRPATPLSIGAKGEINGVALTVIGIIGKEERYGADHWSWVEHQLYSPSHGYAWLTWEEGHLVFTRKIREAPRPARLSHADIEKAENRPAVRLSGKRYQYYASGTAVTTFVEGEFNFVPAIGDRIRYVSCLGDTAMLDLRESEGEMEYELTTLPPRAALLESFGLDPETLPPPASMHPLEPFHRTPLQSFTRNTAFAAAFACLVLSLVIMGGERTVHRSELVHAGATYTAEFEITRGSQLVAFDLEADVDNSWAYFEGEVFDEEEEVVASFSHEFGFYHGRDKDGRWAEGSRDGRIRLSLPAGRYGLEVALSESGRWSSKGRDPQQMRIEVREGVVAAWWLWIGAGLFALFGASFLLGRFYYSAKRWSGSDWSDEDDD